MAFQQVMFAAQTVDLLTPAEQTQTVDLLTGEEENKTVDLLTPAEPSAPIEQPIEQSKPIIEENKETENQTVDLLTPGDDEVVPEEGKKSTTTILIGGEEEEETQDDSWDLTPAEITVPEENHDEEEKKDATFEDEEHHENAGVLPWSTDLVKPWSIYREPKKVYRPGEDLDLTELLVEIKTGRSGSLYNIEDLINDEFTTITRTRKSDGEKVRLDDKIYEDETMTIHMDGCQDLTIDFTVDENLKDEEEALEAFQENLIREEFRDGLDFSLYLIKKGERENPIVAYSLDPHKLTPIGNGVDKKLKDGPLFDLKDINTWDRLDIETIGKVKAILERSAEIKNNENVRKKLITQLAIWNVTSNIIPREIDATVSEIEENETNEFGPELKPTDEEEVPEEKEEEPIEIIDPTTPEEEIESVKQDDEGEAVEEKAEIEEKTEIEETVEEKTEAEEPVEEKTQENKESEKIEEQAPVQSTVHKIVFDVRDIDLPYNEVELSDEEYALYNELTSLEAIELKSEDEDLKIYEPIIEETENPYADLVTIGESDIDSIERVETEVTFDAVDYSFQNLYHTLETSSMLGFGQPRDFNVLLKATMKASRKIVEGDKFEVEILSKTLPILNGEEGRANDIQIDGKVVATAEYIAEEHKIVYTFVEDLDTDKVEIEQEFKQIKEEKAALLNMLDVSENLVLDAVRGAEGDEDSEENSDELEISPEDDNATIKLVLGNTPVKYNGYSFETKKFRLKTTMTAKAAPVWQIPVGWTFDVKIGDYLKPDPNYPLKDLRDPDDPSVVIAKPTYNPNTHTITYTYAESISSTKTLDIDQYLAFDTKAIDDREEIEINIVVAPKDNKVQRIPTIKVRKDDPRSEIISGNIEEKRDFSEVSYPYMVSYTSRQTVNGSFATWDIEVDTEPLKRDDLDYNKIALALYIPQNQGLSNSKIYIDDTEYDFDASSGIDLFSKSIPKNEIPDTLKIHVEADVLTERDSYSLGIRITPDKGYIRNLRENVQAKLNSLKPTITPLVTIFNYLKDLNNSRQFDNGFNLLDTRITATGVPENGSERAVGYNDPLRTFYSYRIDNKKIGFKLSETIDLKNIKSSIGSDVYDKGKLIFNNVSKFDKAKPIVNIYIPVNDSQSENFGKYERFELGKVDKNAFNKEIKTFKDRIIPGTIIEYDFPGEQSNQKNDFSMKMTLDEREVFIDNLYAYQKAGGNVEAKFINVGNKKEQYRVGKYVFQNIFNAGDYKGPVLFKVLENGEDGFCINPNIPNPTNTGNHHSKIVFGDNPTDDELKALHDAFNMRKNAPNFSATTTKAKLDKFKKIFYCYDRYIRENNLDPINDEEVKYIVRDAKQAAIFDVVNGSGLDFLKKGYPQEAGREVYTSGTKTIAFYDKLNKYIDSYPDLTEDQLKSVTITLYPIDGGNFQNIISGRVKNPVYIEKRDQNGDALIGAKFQITRKFSKRIVAEWTSNGGPQELYLDPGEYTLKEVEAPTGYDKIDDVDFTVEEKITEKNIRVSRLNGTNDEYFDSKEIYKDIVISINSDVQDVNQTNKYMFTVINKKHGFKIKKVDAGDNKLLENAEFTLYDTGNNEVKKVLTDAKGIAEFTGLEPGTYILKETQAPEGYNTNNKPVYVNIPEEGEITFSNFQDKIELDSTIFTYIKEEDITKKAAVFDGIIGKKEQVDIEEHYLYDDFMNLKTNLISADQNTVKTRIFLNPSTDPKKGMGPNRNTILTLSKNNANSVDYKVYKILKSEKASITEEEILKKTPVVNGSINNNSTVADIDFKTYGTYATPHSTDEERWHGDAYIIDITSCYIGKNDLSDETREIDYNWKYINSSGDEETNMSGKVGATVKFKEEDVIVKEGDTILEIKNSKVGKFIVQKVDADDENKRLEGAEFTLYEFTSNEEAERKVVKTVTTEADGLAEFNEIKPGKYILEETKVPDGYSKIDSKLIVEVGENGEVKFSNIDDYKDIFTKTTTFTKKGTKLTINRTDHNQDLIQTHPYTAFMNLTAKVIDADEKSMTSRIYLNSLKTDEGYGPNRLTNLELSSPNSTGIKTTVYKVPFANKGSIKDIDNYISATNPKPIANDLRQGSSDEVVKFSCDGQNRWHGSAYVVDVKTTYDAIDPVVDATANITRTLKYYWYNLDDNASWIKQDISSDVSVKKEMVDIEYENTCVLKVKNKKNNTKVTVVKVDENDTNQKIPGAKFEIFHEGENTPIKQKDGNDFVITGDDGKATFEDLKPGTYIIEEIEAPKGYEKTDNIWIVTVSEDKKVTVIEREIDNSGQEFAAINKNEPRIISYGEKQLLKVQSTISINTDGTYTAKLNLNRLDTENNGQIDIFFDNKNFVFYDDTIRAKDGWKYINLSKANVNNVFEFKFSPKASLNDETYFPITRIAYMGVKLDEKFLPTLNKLIRDGSVSNKDKGKYIIVQPNNSYRVWDNDRYKNDLVLVKTEISKIKDSDSYYLDVVMDRKYDGYFRLDNEVIFDTSLFDVYTDDPSYGLDATGKAKFWIDCDKKYSQNSIVRYKITPKEGIFGKLQPIKSLKFGRARVDESDNDGMYRAYILARKEQKVEVENSGNEFSFNATNRFKGYNIKFTKYEIIKKEEIKISDVEFKIQVLDGDDYRDFTVEEKQLVNDISKSDINGIVEFKGLRPGKYRLIETKAPDVYRIPKDPVKYFEITKEGKTIIYRLDDNSNLVEDTSDKKLMIKNDRVGDGEFELIKYDPNEPDPKNPKNKKPLAGVAFELYKSNGEKYGETVNTDKEGKISFKNLPFDRYTLREVETLPGYILDPEEKTILIGKQWEVPKDVNGNEIKGSDVSRFLELNKEASRIESSSGNDTVKPNNSELISVSLKYNILSEDGIKPGDTFTLVTSKNVDLDSISRVPDYKYDIYGPAGRLAAAKIGEDRKSITYTFTEYLESATLTDLNIGMLLAVDRFTVKKNGEIDVAIDFKDSGNTVNEFNKKINVDYTYSKYYDLNGCLVKYIEGSNKTPQVKDTFRVIYYIKNHRFAQVDSYSKNLEIYSDDVDFTIKKVKAYKVESGQETIPWSFGLDLKEGQNDNQYGLNWVGNYFAKDSRDNKKYLINLNPDDLDKSEYVVEVIGTVDNLHDNPFTLKCRYNRVYRQYDAYYYYDSPIYEIATVYKKKKEASSSADTTFRLDVPNYKNKIEYTKVDGSIKGTAIDKKPEDKTEDNNKPMSVPRPMFLSQGNPLSGVQFQLMILNKETNKYTNYGDSKKSDSNGKFSWEGLPEGEYQVVEIGTLPGYSEPENPVSTFKVNKKGEIVNIKDNTTIIINERIKPDIEFQKVDGNKKTVKLEGAEFTLYKAKKDTNGEYEKVDGALQFGMVDNKFNILPDVDDKGKQIPEDKKNGYKVTSDADGKFKFEGLEDGIYAVKETKAPAGYAKLLDYVFYFKVEGGKITEVDKNGKPVLVNEDGEKVEEGGKEHVVVDMSLTPIQSNPIEIENFKAEYPHTGGVGALPFVFIGMMIMMVGAYMFIRRRDALYE